MAALKVSRPIVYTVRVIHGVIDLHAFVGIEPTGQGLIALM